MRYGGVGFLGGGCGRGTIFGQSCLRGGDNVPAYALETGLPENLRASRREGRPGTLLAKLSIVQDGRQADVCPVAWDIVWGFILLDFGCKKDIFYIEIIGFMVY